MTIPRPTDIRERTRRRAGCLRLWRDPHEMAGIQSADPVGLSDAREIGLDTCLVRRRLISTSTTALVRPDLVDTFNHEWCALQHDTGASRGFHRCP